MEKAITMSSCGGLLVQDLGPLPPAENGCILELSLSLEGVRPETRTALALTLSELDEADREYPRGTKILLVPAHHEEMPLDLPVEGIRFILPRELSVGGTEGRRFRVQAECQCVDCPAVCVLPEG